MSYSEEDIVILGSKSRRVAPGLVKTYRFFVGSRFFLIVKNDYKREANKRMISNCFVCRKHKREIQVNGGGTCLKMNLYMWTHWVE